MNSGIIAYSVVAGVIGLAYIAVIIFTGRRKSRGGGRYDSSGENIAARDGTYNVESARNRDYQAESHKRG